MTEEQCRQYDWMKHEDRHMAEQDWRHMKEHHLREASESPEKVLTADVGGRRGPDVVPEGEWRRDVLTTSSEAPERPDGNGDVPTTLGEARKTATTWLQCTTCWKGYDCESQMDRCCNAPMAVHTK